ncbi:response regulator transcription factor [Sphingomonas sp.]|uniref:response regulator transcription factor n=1 Tax=Sphingomonas sp. TaxID=28214 RepID=UPI003B3A20E8
MPAGDAPLVLILDDDGRVRDALSELLASVGIESLSFAAPADLILADLPDRPGCIILDVRMPGGSGLELQRQALDDRRLSKPIIFLTGHGDIPMSVQAMKAGAVDFLVKPARDQTLLDAVSTGIERDRIQRKAAGIRNALLHRYARLTPREREVMGFVCLGRLNKQIAYAMDISEVTVKLHRGNVMSKMEFATVGELIRAWELIEPALASDLKPVRQDATL